MNEVLLNIFIAYSRENSSLRDRLDKHLSGLKRKKYINTWYDGQIEAGTEWEKEIELALNQADIILLLISADFIASDYCYDVEMKKAISRHEKGDAVIIPIILNPCDWTDLPFSKIQGLPQNGVAITSEEWNSIEVPFTEVAKSIKSIVENLRIAKNKHLLAINEVLNEKESELLIALEQVEELKIEEEITRENIENLTQELKKLNSNVLEVKKDLEILNNNHSANLNVLSKKQLREQSKLDAIKKKAQRAEAIIEKHDNIKKEIPILSKKLSSITKEINKKTDELSLLKKNE
jgi:hypothetical protein